MCTHIQEYYDRAKVTCSLSFEAYKCSLHKYCIPNWKPKGMALEKWYNRKPESNIFRLCEYCPDKNSEKKLEPASCEH